MGSKVVSPSDHQEQDLYGGSPLSRLAGTVSFLLYLFALGSCVSGEVNNGLLIFGFGTGVSFLGYLLAGGSRNQ